MHLPVGRESMGLKKTEHVSKRSSFIRTVTFFLCSMMAAGMIQAETPKTSSDAYVSSSIGDARILIPFLADDVSSNSICQLVYNGLTKIDRDLNIIGDLAEKWEITNDGLTIKFFIKKNVKWHDGMPLTAEDVKFTFETILDPKVGCPYISGFSDIKEITVVDAHTIVFEYKQPYAPALIKLGMGVIPKHLFKGIEDIRRSKYARSPVGTGPYKFSKWETGQYIVLEANTDYFEHAPGIKRYVFRIIPDQSVEYLELLSGGIDSMMLTPYQYRYRAGEEEFTKKLEKYSYLAPSYTYIGYNLKDPLFADKKVRQALSYALNKNEMIDASLFGLGEDCTGPFRKDSVYYDRQVTLYPYDIKKAAELLKECGWQDIDGDGVLEKNGQKFAFKIVTNQGNQTREDVATMVQRQWSKIGVKVEIQVISWAALLSQFIDKGNFQAVILGWENSIDPDIFPVFHSEAITPKGLNFVSYSNKEVDDLIEAGRKEFDDVKRADIYHRIHRIIADDAPYTFLFFTYRTPAIHKRFKGIDPAPAGIGYNFIEWYVDDNEVRYDF